MNPVAGRRGDSSGNIQPLSLCAWAAYRITRKKQERAQRPLGRPLVFLVSFLVFPPSWYLQLMLYFGKGPMKVRRVVLILPSDGD